MRERRVRRRSDVVQHAFSIVQHAFDMRSAPENRPLSTRVSSVFKDLRRSLRKKSLADVVMPANAGIHGGERRNLAIEHAPRRWIPAFAGMTGGMRRAFQGLLRKNRRRRPDASPGGVRIRAERGCEFHGHRGEDYGRIGFLAIICRVNSDKTLSPPSRPSLRRAFACRGGESRKRALRSKAEVRSTP